MAAMNRWELMLAALLAEPLPEPPCRPGRVCHGTYLDRTAAGLLRLQLEDAAAVRPGWRRSRSAAHGPGRRQW